MTFRTTYVVEILSVDSIKLLEHSSQGIKSSISSFREAKICTFGHKNNFLRVLTMVDYRNQYDCHR